MMKYYIRLLCLVGFLFLIAGAELRAQLKLTPTAVGIKTLNPEFDLDVRGDLFVRSNFGAIMLGYPSNGNQWRFTTINGGEDMLYRFKAEGSNTFTTRMVHFSNGDIAIGADPVSSNARLELLQNSGTTDPQLLLTEQQNDFARLSFENTAYQDKRWTIAGYPGSTPANSKMNFWFQDTNGGADRMTIQGDGRVGINNTNPDEELVIGSNLGSGWDIPAITVGNNVGGAIELGSTGYSISMEASTTFNRSRIVSSSGTGVGTFGKGAIEIRANAGVAIGDSPGPADGYMLQIVHNTLGINLERSGSDEDWEVYASTNGNLWLYHNSTFRGSFDGATGAYVQSSDRRLKQGVKDLESVLDRVMAMRPTRYSYKNGGKRSKETVGFIAQEVESLFPEVVHVQEGDREDGTYGINYDGIGPIAIKAIQELKSEMDEKDQYIAELEERLTRIETLITEGQTAQNYLVLENTPAELERAALKQNVPNPFETLTTIAYTIPEQAQQAQLQIADANGRVLRKMEIRQRGQVQTTLDAQQLPAGTYYYSLWVDGQLIGTKKMLLGK
jgi:hypothetical protein